MTTNLTQTLAHAAHGLPHDGPWYTAWNWDWLILPSLLMITAAYTCGLHRIWKRAGRGHGVTTLQASAFYLGILALFAALISPIDVLANELSWVHMIQHMLIMMVAAPLLILGSPLRILLFALPLQGRSRLGAILNPLLRHQLRLLPYLLWQPLVTWSLYALTLWIWHIPTLYEAALQNDLIHDAQHLAFLITACLFWRVMLDPLAHRRLNLGLGTFYLFTSSLHASALGVFLALSPRLWYPHYANTTEPWGLTALQDQQLAGLIMWIPACTVYAVVVAAMFALWIKHLDHPRPPRPLTA